MISSRGSPPAPARKSGPRRAGQTSRPVCGRRPEQAAEPGRAESSGKGKKVRPRQLVRHGSLAGACYARERVGWCTRTAKSTAPFVVAAASLGRSERSAPPSFPPRSDQPSGSDEVSGARNGQSLEKRGHPAAGRGVQHSTRIFWGTRCTAPSAQREGGREATSLLAYPRHHVVPQRVFPNDIRHMHDASLSSD